MAERDATAALALALRRAVSALMDRDRAISNLAEKMRQDLKACGYLVVPIAEWVALHGTAPNSDFGEPEPPSTGIAQK
jgi:hypothetical protein